VECKQGKVYQKDGKRKMHKFKIWAKVCSSRKNKGRVPATGVAGKIFLGTGKGGKGWSNWGKRETGVEGAVV